MHSSARTHGVIEFQRGRLLAIGSVRDPAAFQAMRAHVRDERTMNRTVIVNWADEDTRFGCRFACKFCSWRERATAAGDIAPTQEGLRRFLDGFSGAVVTISGGGDPLFKLHANWPRLHQLLGWIHDLGYLAEVVTKETALVRNVLGWSGGAVAMRPGMAEAVHRIDQYSLSYESHGAGLVEEARAIAAHRPVRVSKVCSPGLSGLNSTVGDREVNRLGQYCAAFRGAGAYQVLLREDANHIGRLPIDDAADVVRAIKLGRGGVRWLPSAVCTDNLFLINNKMYRNETLLEEFCGT